MQTEGQVAQENETPSVEMLDKDHGLIEIDSPDDAENAPVDIDDARANIYAKHAEKRKEELRIVDEPAPDAAKPEPVTDEEITVKVNGREKQVPKSKVDAAGGVEAYQKNAAASEMLNQASAKHKELQQIEARLAEKARQIEEKERLLHATTQQSAHAGLPDAGALKAMARQYHEAMLDGNLDIADDLLLKMNAAQTATAINPEDIATRAVQRARAELTAEQRQQQAARFEADRQEAVAEFQEKYKDLAVNPDAHSLVDAKTIEVHREHPDWGPKAIIHEAANRVKSMIQNVSGIGRPSDKLEAKRQMTQIRSGSARTAPKPAPRPQTNSEYVASLRQQRGLGV